MGSAESCAVSDPENLGTDGLLPGADTLTHDTLLKQHRFSFDSKDDGLLSVDCCAGSSPDPLTKQLDHYLAVGLRTKFDGPGVQKYGHPPVNLVVVIDVSGSMNAHFKSESGEMESKLKAVKEVIAGNEGLMYSLRQIDKLAIMTFNTETKVIQDLTNANCILRDRVLGMLDKQAAVGATTLSKAMTVAHALLDHEAEKIFHPSSTFTPPPPLAEIPPKKPTNPLDDGTVEIELELVAPQPPMRRLHRADTMYCRNLVDPPENRVIVLTDEYLGSEPDHEVALRIMRRMAVKQKIHTTFVGVGVNHPPSIARRIASVPGCSCTSVHDAAELRNAVVGEFEHAVFPIATDVAISVTSPLSSIETFGAAVGPDVMHVKSVFAGAGKDEVHCNVGIVRLKEPLSGQLKYTVNFKDRLGVQHGEEVVCELVDSSQKNCFRKSVALARLGTLLRVFLLDEHAGCATVHPTITQESGIIPLPEILKIDSGPCPVRIDKGEEVEDEETGPEGEGSPVFSDTDGDHQTERGLLEGQDWSNDPVLDEPNTSESPGLPAVPASSSPLPFRNISLACISDHYKSILTRFVDDYFEKEVEELGDTQLRGWLKFIRGMTQHVSDEEVEKACDTYITVDLIHRGADSDSVFDTLNSEKYQNRLRENHRRAVHHVFNQKMQTAILTAVGELVEANPVWVVPTDAILQEVLLAVRGTFRHLEEEEAWEEWKERWENLVAAALRSALHGRVFEVAKRMFEGVKSQPLTTQQIGDSVMQELARISPETIYSAPSSGPPLSGSHDAEPTLSLPTPLDPAAMSPQAKDTQAFLARWILPALLKYDGECKWSSEQGVPISTSEDTSETESAVSQCPTQ